MSAKILAHIGGVRWIPADSASFRQTVCKNSPPRGNSKNVSNSLRLYPPKTLSDSGGLNRGSPESTGVLRSPIKSATDIVRRRLVLNLNFINVRVANYFGGQSAGHSWSPPVSAKIWADKMITAADPGPADFCRGSTMSDGVCGGQSPPWKAPTRDTRLRGCSHDIT